MWCYPASRGRPRHRPDHGPRERPARPDHSWSPTCRARRGPRVAKSMMWSWVSGWQWVQARSPSARRRRASSRLTGRRREPIMWQVPAWTWTGGRPVPMPLRRPTPASAAAACGRVPLRLSGAPAGRFCGQCGPATGRATPAFCGIRFVNLLPREEGTAPAAGLESAFTQLTVTSACPPSTPCLDSRRARPHAEGPAEPFRHARRGGVPATNQGDGVGLVQGRERPVFTRQVLGGRARMEGVATMVRVARRMSAAAA